MDIVILDADTTTGNDLNWSALESFGNITIYSSTPAELIVERSKDAEVVLTNKVPFREATLQQLPKLKYIGITATGYDIIDLKASSARGITVCNAAGYSTTSVAQHVFALLLGLSNQVSAHSEAVHQGAWTKVNNWTFRLTPLVELQGLKLGIVGLGTIGQAVASLGQAFGMDILAYSRTQKVVEGVSWCTSVEELFSQSDVISLHAPLTEANRAFVNADLLSKMKPTAFLINTARGALINEADLAIALKEGVLAGAGLDVLSAEPPVADHPLVGAPNCLITPHIAWATRSSRARLIDQVVDNVRAFQAGTPQNVLKP